MKNIYNALEDVASMYNDYIDWEIEQYIPEENRWIVSVRNKDAPGSLLQVEVIDDGGIPKCCVLQKTNVGRKSMFRFMDRLVNAFDD
jgi:hypothetical protein